MNNKNTEFSFTKACGNWCLMFRCCFNVYFLFITTRVGWINIALSGNEISLLIRVHYLNYSCAFLVMGLGSSVSFKALCLFLNSYVTFPPICRHHAYVWWVEKSIIKIINNLNMKTDYNWKDLVPYPLIYLFFFLNQKTFTYLFNYKLQQIIYVFDYKINNPANHHPNILNQNMC